MIILRVKCEEHIGDFIELKLEANSSMFMEANLHLNALGFRDVYIDKILNGLGEVKLADLNDGGRDFDVRTDSGYILVEVKWLS